MQSIPPTPSTLSTLPLPEIEPESLMPGDVWLEDGNVILAAQGVSFRAHRSVLSRNSEVFQDMFAFPQPEKQSENLEGCPVVQLSDNASELSHFLSALYDGRRYVTLLCIIVSYLKLISSFNDPLIAADILVKTRRWSLMLS